MSARAERRAAERLAFVRALPRAGQAPVRVCSTCGHRTHRPRAPESLDCAECVAEAARTAALAPERGGAR